MAGAGRGGRRAGLAGQAGVRRYGDGRGGRVAVGSSRAPARAWLGWLMAIGLVAALGFAWQASASGWQALWRGYSGYDMVAQGAFWGSNLGAKRWLASVAAFWLAVAPASGWAGGAGRAGARLWFAAALASLALGIALVASSVLLRFGPDRALAEISWRWWLSGVLQWLVAAPWALLTPLLLGAAWLGRKYQAPPPWWALWSFALLANLRLLLLGYSSGVAIAPALAVFAWLATAHDAAAAQPPAASSQNRWRPAALAILLILTVVNLLAQVLTPDVPAARAERGFQPVWATIAIDNPAGAAQAAAIQASIADQALPGDVLFAHGWGAAWYLLTGRANRTPFDVALAGMFGPGSAEAVQMELSLLQQPPAVVVLPVEYWPPGSESASDAEPISFLARQPAAVVGQPATGLRSGAFIGLGQVGGVVAAVN
ncbi:MAG: hypothetical protein V9H69_11195 [Anaerolineae bacterium]